jgi:hypothetical protein
MRSKLDSEFRCFWGASDLKTLTSKNQNSVWDSLSNSLSFVYCVLPYCYHTCFVDKSLLIHIIYSYTLPTLGPQVCTIQIQCAPTSRFGSSAIASLPSFPSLPVSGRLSVSHMSSWKKQGRTTVCKDLHNYTIRIVYFESTWIKHGAINGI